MTMAFGEIGDANLKLYKHLQNVSLGYSEIGSEVARHSASRAALGESAVRCDSCSSK